MKLWWVPGWGKLVSEIVVGGRGGVKMLVKLLWVTDSGCTMIGKVLWVTERGNIVWEIVGATCRLSAASWTSGLLDYRI